MSFWQKVLKKSSAILKAAFGLALFVCTAYLIFSIFIYLRIDRSVYEGTYNLVFCLVAFSVMFLVQKISSINREPIIKIKKLGFGQVIALIIIALGMLGMVTTYMGIVNKIAESKETVSQAVEEYRENVDRFADVSQTVVPVWDSVLYVINLCFIVPVVEEMTFRGIVFGQLRREFGPWTSVIISAIGFGIMHGLTIHIGYAIACGLIIATTYHLTESLIAPIILHAVFNIIGSGIPTFMSIEELGIPQDLTRAILVNSHTASILFMPVSVLAIAYLVNEKRKKAKKVAAHAEEVSFAEAVQENDPEDKEIPVNEECVTPDDDGSEAAS